jgi:hypothetical protein
MAPRSMIVAAVGHWNGVRSGPEIFSLEHGGPLDRLVQAVGRRRLIIGLVAVTWIPLQIMASAEWASSRRFDPEWLDWSLHVRLLIALPLLLGADPWLGLMTERSTQIIVEGEWARERQPAATAIILRAARSLRSAWPEIVLIVLSLLGSQLINTPLAADLGMRRGMVHSGWSPYNLWYRVVSLPVYQFLVYRALWRWLIWCRLLLKLARVPLRPIATHPDRQGGLGFLAESSRAFGLVLLAINAVQAAAWANRLDIERAKVESLALMISGAVVLSLGLALGPLLAFTPALWRERLTGLREYGRLARQHGRLFHSRWIEHDRQEELLGAPDISSQADMGTSYDVIREMALIPFGARTVVVVVVATLIPVVPLLLREMPLTEVAKKLLGTALGGLS